MTRQEIEQLNEVEPYCFETDLDIRFGCVDFGVELKQ